MTDDLGFERAYEGWLAAPFPKGSSIDEIDELHAELAQWDAAVADEAIPTLEGFVPKYRLAAAGEGIAGFIERLEVALSKAPEDGRVVLDQYLAYARLIRNVHSTMAAVLAGREPDSDGKPWSAPPGSRPSKQIRQQWIEMARSDNASGSALDVNVEPDAVSQSSWRATNMVPISADEFERQWEGAPTRPKPGALALVTMWLR